MKKFISLFLTLLMLFTCAPISTFAAEETQTSGACGDNATWTFDGTTLTISGTGKIDCYVNPNSSNSIWEELKDNVKKVIVNEGITSLGYAAFINFSVLEEIKLPNSLVWMDQQIFQGCHKLTEINIPANLSGVDVSVAGAFSGDGLVNINVDPRNEYFSSVDGILFDKNRKTLYCYPDGKSQTSYIVPDGVEFIESNAFSDEDLESITLPNSLLEIRDFSFSRLKLKNIALSDNLTRIGKYAFSYCKQLTAITIPKSIQFIDANAFYCCDKLKTITILSDKFTISNKKSTIPSHTELYGYANSTTELYAKNYGLLFTNIETGKQTNYYLGNSGYIALLPTDIECSATTTIQIYSVDSSSGVEEITSYQPSTLIITDTENEYYKEMLALAEELSEGCENDYEKAKNVCDWVSTNMTYVFGAGSGSYCEKSLYNIWEYMAGNCERYTMLTGFLLYLMDIPTATIIIPGHIVTGALIDNEWIIIDSTNGLFDIDPDNMRDIEQIAFTVNDNVVCIINDLSGVKLADYGIYTYEPFKKINDSEITIPEFITYCYPLVIPKTLNKNLPIIHGVKGSYMEQYLHEERPVYNQFVYEGNMFTAKVVSDFPGDINNDGNIDKSDYSLLKRYCFGTLSLSQAQLLAADVNGDGEIDKKDYTLIKRHCFGTYTIE